MAKPLPSDSPFAFTLFKRPAVDGHVVFYARFIEKATGTILSQRSMGTDDEREAAAQAGRLMTQLPLANIAKAKASHTQDDYESAESLRNMDLASYFTWFWTPGVSAYLRDRVEAEKPLSNYYVQTQGRYITKYATIYAPFKKTLLREASLYLSEQWMHNLKRQGLRPNVIVDVLGAIRTPLSWAVKRNLLDEPFSLAGIIRPKEHHEKRGILSRTEVAKIIALPTVDSVVPRPRPKKGEKNEGTAPIDLRQKAVVLLSELAALRRGEIRALRWHCVDLDNKLITVEANFIDSDGFKEPKRESYGVVPIAKELGTVLKELKTHADKVGRAAPEDFVIFNVKRGVPVAEVTMRRGFHRALALIGIEDDKTASKEGRPPKPGSQQARRLVLHSGRHGAATRLAEKVGPRDAARITRHRSAQAFAGYSDHSTEEFLERAREALSVNSDQGSTSGSQG
jgi:integrase